MPRRLALDANLLVLLVVGQVSRAFIRKHKCLRSYSVADFELLLRVIAGFERILVTPNASTDTANQIVYGVDDPLRSRFMQVLGLVLRGADEHYRSSAEISRNPDFVRLGLSVSVWLSILDDESVLLTADRDLHIAALGRGLHAYHFADVRRNSGHH